MPLTPQILPGRRAIALGVLLLGAMATPALALNAPGTPTTGPTPSRSTTWTFSWTAPDADADYAITGYRGGLDGSNQDLGSAPSATLTAGEGSHSFQVQAVETSTLDPGLPTIAGPLSQKVTFRVDTQGPKITPNYPLTPNGLRGWYRLPFTVAFSCSDLSLPVAPCGPNRTFLALADGTSQGTKSVTGAASDSLGNTNAVTVGPFNIDLLPPSEALPSAPGVGAVTATEPTFTWSRSRAKETSGYEHYEVQALLAGVWRTISSVPYPQPPAAVPDTFSAARNPAVWPTPLPERTALQWRVMSFDNAGNSTASTTRTFTVDSTAPTQPSITGGPTGPGRNTTPTFAWLGTLPSFNWAVTLAGAVVPAQTGSGTATTTTLKALADGDYVFSVSQISIAGVTGVEATRAFTVDTVAPPPPTITARPTMPTTSATPAFEWAGEPNTSFRWQVVGTDGSSVQTPTETLLPSATVGPFGPGGYTFRVSQIDAAGNVSGAATDPFTIAGATAPPTKTAAALPKQHANRLRPRASQTVRTRRPVLSWKGGPAATTFFNVQIFRVGKKGAPSAKVVKIFSAFPRGHTLQLPKDKLVAGYCYAWRVWPYVKSAFTREPLGVSNFCVAKKIKVTIRAVRKH